MRSIVFLVGLASAAAAQGTVGIPLTRHIGSDSEQVPLAGDTSKASSAVGLGSASVSYFANILVGTPPVFFTALLDTGSSDLVIESAVQADSCNGCTTTGPLYNAKDSSTSVVTTTPVQIVYGIGNDSGVVVSDTVSFGNFSLNTTIAACNLNSLFGNIGQTTALLGLGWTNLAATNATPFVEQLWKAGLLTNPVFGLGFANTGANSAGKTLVSGGYLTLGDTNRSLYTGELVWTSLSESNSGYWDIPVNNMLLNGVNLGLSTGSAVIDSGTNGIVVPTNVYQAIYQAIPGAEFSPDIKRYIYPCATNVSLAFVLGGTTFTMMPATFQRSVVTTDGTGCTGTVRDGGMTDQPWIIGASFFESFYSAFRFDPPAVGFAPIANPGNILGTNTIPTVKSKAITATGTSAPTSRTSASSSAAPRLAVSIQWAPALVTAAGVVVGAWAL